MRTAVDSSILLDIIKPDPQFGRLSLEALRKAYSSGSLVVCDVVWAEAAAHFEDTRLLQNTFQAIGVRFDPISQEAATLAGRSWRRYCVDHPRRRPGSVVADFLIGAHASLAADALLTRDRGFYRRYFSSLLVIDPSR